MLKLKSQLLVRMIGTKIWAEKLCNCLNKSRQFLLSFWTFWYSLALFMVKMDDTTWVLILKHLVITDNTGYIRYKVDFRN